MTIRVTSDLQCMEGRHVKPAAPTLYVTPSAADLLEHPGERRRCSRDGALTFLEDRAQGLQDKDPQDEVGRPEDHHDEEQGEIG